MEEELDLAFFSTEDLVDELVKRFDHVIFAGLKVQGDELPYIIHRRQEGNHLTCIGLATSLATYLSIEHEEAGESAVDEDDEDEI